MANLLECSRCKLNNVYYFGTTQQICYDCKNIIAREQLKNQEQLEEEWMKVFYEKNKFPSYREVVELNRCNLSLVCDYEEDTHNLLNELWDNILTVSNDQNIKDIGRIIYRSGTYLAIMDCQNIFTMVLQYALKSSGLDAVKQKGILVNSITRIKTLWYEITN